MAKVNVATSRARTQGLDVAAPIWKHTTGRRQEGPRAQPKLVHKENNSPRRERDLNPLKFLVKLVFQIPIRFLNTIT